MSARAVSAKDAEAAMTEAERTQLRTLAAPYPDQWLEAPERMMEKTEKLLGLHKRWQDRGSQVLGIVVASRGVIVASSASAHQRMVWLSRLTAIEDELWAELRMMGFWNESRAAETSS